MQLTKEIRDRSVFGVNARQKGTGPESGMFSAVGFYDATIDIERTYQWAEVPVSLFIPSTAGAAVAAGDNAIFFKALFAGYKRGAPFGDDAMFNFQAEGHQDGYPIGIGKVLNPGLVPVTADNTPAASVVNLGAVSATQYLYVVLHVTAVSTDEAIIVKIQSHEDDAFGGVTEVMAFASQTAPNGLIAARVAGPLTDAYYRAYADVTVTGEPCSITFACAAGIR